MRRGMRKFSVTAAHSVITKNDSLRRTNLIARASAPGSRPYPFGLRCSSITPMSGVLYAAGCAKGLLGVTQPVIDFVLYWYQSTCSVTGMTGIREVITAASLRTIECWSALLVVAPYASISASTLRSENRSSFDDAVWPIGAVFFE